MPRKPLSNAGATYKASTGTYRHQSLATTRSSLFYRRQMSGTEAVGILVAPALSNRRTTARRSSGAILLRTQLSAVRDGSGTDSGTSTGTHVRSRLFRRQKKIRDSHHGFDATPGYLFYSSILPRRILCVAPWVKLNGATRDPVDQWRRITPGQTQGTETNGRMDRQGLCTARSCWNVESYYRPGSATANFFSGSTEEDVAYSIPPPWRCDRRGLCEIQLRQWFQKPFAPSDAIPQISVLIVRAERTRVRRNRTDRF
jgi:hypothetical protein